MPISLKRKKDISNRKSPFFCIFRVVDFSSPEFFLARFDFFPPPLTAPGTGPLKSCPQGLFFALLTFLRPNFFRPVSTLSRPH